MAISAHTGRAVTLLPEPVMEARGRYSQVIDVLASPRLTVFCQNCYPSGTG